MTGKAKFAAGCFVALVVIVGVAVYVVPRLFQKGVEELGKAIEEQTEWSSLAGTWTAPAENIAPDRLFPAQVADFKLGGHDQNAAIPELGVQKPGLHATYESAYGNVDLYAYRMSDAEKVAVIQGVKPALDARDTGGAMRVTSTSGSPEGTVFIYSISPPKEKGIFWSDEGWLFLARVKGGLPPKTLLKPYLEAVSGRE